MNATGHLAQTAVPAVVALTLAGALGGCSAAARSAPVAARTVPASAAAPPTPAAPDSSTAPTPGARSRPTPVAVSASARPRPLHAGALPPFSSAVQTVTAADLTSTYRPGCPTPPSGLRMLTLSFVDFSGHAHTGHLVVDAAQVGAVTAVFADLYAERFPIRKMVPVNAYGGSDEKSVADDNTAGFNCRAAVTSSGPTSWSMHAYGDAIDVDPVENPYIDGTLVDPPAGAAYLDRSARRPGMALAGGALVTAFARQGWHWGVTFADYQHFSTNGR